jgi:hypothetical protein
MRDNLGPARVQGAPQGRLLDKRRGKGVVVLSGEFPREAELDWNLPVWLGLWAWEWCRVGRFNLVKIETWIGVDWNGALGGTLG